MTAVHRAVARRFSKDGDKQKTFMEYMGSAFRKPKKIKTTSVLQWLLLRPKFSPKVTAAAFTICRLTSCSAALGARGSPWSRAACTVAAEEAQPQILDDHLQLQYSTVIRAFL